MNILVIGVGYVGLIQAAGLAKYGYNVTCLDIDQEKIYKLLNGEMPFYEPGLKEIVLDGIKKDKLKFVNSFEQISEKIDIIFICVGTPSNEDGSVNMGYVKDVAIKIGKWLKYYCVIVNKSTVPVGTGIWVKNIISKYYEGEFSVVSNPEFLAQGQAVNDFFYPDRVVLGFLEYDKKAREIMAKLYGFYSCEKLFTNIQTAELIKYSSNSFLATQISFINSMAGLCEKVGADVRSVAKGMKLDKRISNKAFLNAGIGYGGSCFAKDIKGLLQIASDNNYLMPLIKDVEKINLLQRDIFFNKIGRVFANNFSNKKIGIWGLSFKPNTDDIRDAPSLSVIRDLVLTDIDKIVAYDPVANERFISELNHQKITFVNQAIEAINDVDILVIFTEWDEFKNFDLDILEEKLQNKAIIDGRNIFDKEKLAQRKISYIGIGI